MAEEELIQEDDSRDVDHSMIVESTQVWRGEVPPELSERLTSDGTAVDAHGYEEKNVSISLELFEEVKLTFECRCGQKFRKPETAREHLESES